MNLIRRLLYILLLFPYIVSGQQNHVVNGDFETVVSCPTNISQVFSCFGWRPYTTGTADYYNACNNGIVGVPSKSSGLHVAARGNAYCRIILHIGATDPSAYAEYVASSMQPLIPGTPYELSLSVNV